MIGENPASEPVRPADETASWASAFKILRLHQWVKNALVFAPIVLGGKASSIATWRDALIGFIAFGLTASGTYVFNDICDREHDRADPAKSQRPVASGALSVSAAYLLSVTCIFAGLALGYPLVPTAFHLLLLYIALTLAYSLQLRAIAVVDVVVIAGLFTLRLAFGTAVAGVRWSPWLFVLSMSAFLSLALAKRFAEVSRSLDRAQSVAGRGYSAVDIPFIRSLGLSCAAAGVVIMVIYMIEEAFPRNVYADPEALWAVPIILLLFFSRIWISAERGQLTSDPVTFALMDKVCVGLAVALIAVFLAALA